MATTWKTLASFTTCWEPSKSVDHLINSTNAQQLNIITADQNMFFSYKFSTIDIFDNPIPFSFSNISTFHEMIRNGRKWKSLQGDPGGQCAWAGIFASLMARLLPETLSFSSQTTPSWDEFKSSKSNAIKRRFFSKFSDDFGDDFRTFTIDFFRWIQHFWTILE